MLAANVAATGRTADSALMARSRLVLLTLSESGYASGELELYMPEHVVADKGIH